MGVPGSNPGGPIIFRRKIEGCQSNTAGGERGLGQGGCSGVNIPREAQFHQTAERD